MTTATPPTHLIGQQQARIARLEVAVVALSVSVLVLAATIAWYGVHGLPVHFIPPGGPGLSQPGVIPDTAALDYGSRWLTARYTFTPATVKAAHADILPTLHPSLMVAFKAQAEREAVLVKEHQLSSQVVITGSRVSQRTAQEVQVVLEAQRMVWIGGQPVREEPLQATLTVVPWVTHGAPAGLVVARVQVSPALTVTGR